MSGGLEAFPNPPLYIEDPAIAEEVAYSAKYLRDAATESGLSDFTTDAIAIEDLTHVLITDPPSPDFRYEYMIRDEELFVSKTIANFREGSKKLSQEDEAQKLVEAFRYPKITKADLLDMIDSVYKLIPSYLSQRRTSRYYNGTYYWLGRQTMDLIRQVNTTAITTDKATAQANSILNSLIESFTDTRATLRFPYEAIMSGAAATYESPKPKK